MHGRWVAWLVAMLIGMPLVGLAACTAQVAAAHPQLRRAVPSPGETVATSPHQVYLLFVEALDPSFSWVQVRNPAGTPMDAGDSHVDPAEPYALVASLPASLPVDAYTVVWHTVSAIDGHDEDGAYRFAVGTALSSAEHCAISETGFAPETSLSRWWFYLAASFAFGPLVFWFVVCQPLGLGADRTDLERTIACLSRLALVGAAALLVGTIYASLAQATTATGAPLWAVLGDPLGETLLRGRYAAIWWPRLLVVALILLVLARWRRFEQAHLALAAAPAVLLSSSLTSHGAALPRNALMGTSVDWLHLIGVCVWVGGLASLLAVLGRVPRPLVPGLIGRFSTTALVAVGVIMATGSLQVWLEVGTWDALWTTAYGWTLTAKVVLTISMVAVGALNLRVGRLSRRAGAAPAAGLGRSILAELGVGVLVLAAAAVLTGLAPPGALAASGA